MAKCEALQEALPLQWVSAMSRHGVVKEMEKVISWCVYCQIQLYKELWGKAEMRVSQESCCNLLPCAPHHCITTFLIAATLDTPR